MRSLVSGFDCPQNREWQTNVDSALHQVVLSRMQQKSRGGGIYASVSFFCYMKIILYFEQETSLRCLKREEELAQKLLREEASLKKVLILSILTADMMQPACISSNSFRFLFAMTFSLNT